MSQGHTPLILGRERPTSSTGNFPRRPQKLKKKKTSKTKRRVHFSGKCYQAYCNEGKDNFDSRGVSGETVYHFKAWADASSAGFLRWRAG